MMALHYFEKIFNVGLRGATLLARFLFIFFLAKYLTPAMVGYYGLFVAAVGYALYFVGLDFYNYVTREILKAPNDRHGQMLKGQAAMSGALYILLVPIALVFFSQIDWPVQLFWWFFPILFLEHLNQELNRLFVALSLQITASIILFIRQGSWAIASVFLMFYHNPSRNIDTVLALWFFAGLVAALMGVLKLRKLKMGGWQKNVDWQWVKKGLGISGALLVATLALRGINTFDRYWLQALGGIDIVGGYVLLLSIAGTLMTLLDAGIFAYAYPKLIRYHSNGERALAQSSVRQVLWQTVVFSGGFALVSWLVLPYFLRWIGNPVYLNATDLYPWILIATVLNALSMVPHFGLYAQGHDKSIIYSHGASLVIFVLSTWLFSHFFGYIAVLVGINLAFAVIFTWKSWAYWTLCGKSR